MPKGGACRVDIFAFSKASGRFDESKGAVALAL
jgi:hypothetical protein